MDAITRKTYQSPKWETEQYCSLFGEPARNVTFVGKEHFSLTVLLCIITPLRKPSTIEARLRWHMRFNGLYARAAKQLGVDPSFVSKVASGTRKSEKVTQALEAEMKRLEKLKPR